MSHICFQCHLNAVWDFLWDFLPPTMPAQNMAPSTTLLPSQWWRLFPLTDTKPLLQPSGPSRVARHSSVKRTVKFNIFGYLLQEATPGSFWYVFPANWFKEFSTCQTWAPHNFPFHATLELPLFSLDRTQKGDCTNFLTVRWSLPSIFDISMVVFPFPSSDTMVNFSFEVRSRFGPIKTIKLGTCLINWDIRNVAAIR